ncbi:UDP-galactose transporter Gms1 [Dispira simplex]|nr:UDP-galactose transporter Gms1 [Dispira simplex]
MKYVSLVTLVVQNSALVLVMRYSRLHSGQNGEAYYTSTAVLLSEWTKLLLSIGLFLYEERNRRKQLVNGHDRGYELAQTQEPGDGQAKDDLGEFVDPELAEPPLTMRWILRQVFGKDSWKLMIPAALYTIQNNLQYIAVSLLDAATFQVTYQLKILTTALCFVIILRKPLNLWQWVSLVILTIGVILVQLPSMTTPDTGTESTDPNGDSWSKVLGLLTVTLACIMSGLAGVYFEKILKGSRTSLWIRNIQLSFYSLFPALFLGVLLKDGAGVRENGFWYGYNGWTFGAIACQALGGIIVALVVKFADNILKGFATSISIILSCVMSVFIFDFHITIMFILGTTAVIYATYLYGTASNAKPSSVPTSSPSPQHDLERGTDVVYHVQGLEDDDTDDETTVVGTHRD